MVEQFDELIAVGAPVLPEGGKVVEVREHASDRVAKDGDVPAILGGGVDG